MGDHEPPKAIQELLEANLKANPRLNSRLAREQEERLLPEVEEILRVAPTLDEFSRDSGSDEHLAWLGRAAAAIERWNIVHMPKVSVAMMDHPSDYGGPCRKTLSTLKILLQQAKSDLSVKLGRSSVVVAEGRVFEYFDELRKLIETARDEVFFVDPYLDADFVARYLPYVAEGVSIRLLSGSKKRATLLPAVESFAQQFGRPISVRVSDGLHDRYLFIDRTACHLSGASFKDGAKNSPAILAQIRDPFQAMWDTYEQQWERGAIALER